MARIRMLVTGFTPFTGAPVNPTEYLMRHFNENPPALGEDVEARFAVLPVDYVGSIPELEALAGEFEPHVSVHFGLAGETSAFRLETTARNEITSAVPDNSDRRPEPRRIVENGGHHVSTLPLEKIAAALEGRGLPVTWSDNAGGYLCNYVFYHAAAGLCAGLPAPMTGFIHVPPVSMPDAPVEGLMAFGALVEGAETILATCIAEHRA